MPDFQVLAAIAPEGSAPTRPSQNLTIGEFRIQQTGMYFIL